MTVSWFSRYRLLGAVVIALVAIQSGARAQTYISGVTAVASSDDFSTPGGSVPCVVNDAGLTPAAGGGLAMTTNRFPAAGLSMWNSGAGNGPFGADRNPYIEFDLHGTYTVNGFRVWNYNEPGFNARGFRDVTVQFSQDGAHWRSIASTFRFAQAPATEGYLGQDVSLPYPVSARYLRFACENNYGAATSGLSKVRFRSCAGTGLTVPPDTDHLFPPDSGIVNVKEAPYNAVGDGVADDTAALQQAITDNQGTKRTVYLPAGIYKVTAPLSLTPATGFGFTNIKGEGVNWTVIRLADNTFTDPANPKAVLDAAFNGTSAGLSADWFNNNFGNFAISTGTGNPGAIGVKFYANNVGALRDVEIDSEDGQGKIGLDLGYADQNGPLLVKNVTVVGFDTGVRLSGSVNSVTMENISLISQRVVGIQNGGQCLSIRNLYAEEAVTVLDNSGFATLVNADLREDEGAGVANAPAVINRATLFARNIETFGYSKVVRNLNGGTPDASGDYASEYVSHPVLRQFGNRLTSLNLEAPETPVAPEEDANTWANVRDYRLTRDADDSNAVERAVASGATTLYFPAQGTFYLSRPVTVGGAVQRIVGMHATIAKTTAGAGFVVGTTGTAPTVWFEDFGTFNNSVDVVNASSRTVVCANLQDVTVKPQGAGPVFLENVACNPISIGAGQSVYARQLNIEGSQTKVTNAGGTFWALGMKSEAGGTLIATTAGGKSELLGGLYYTQSAGGGAPMFSSTDASLSASIAEVNFNGAFFTNLVQETRGATTRTLARNQAPFWVGGSQIPLYVGYDDPTFLAPPFNLQAAGGTTAVSLSWDPMPRATSYAVRRATSASGPFSTVASGLTGVTYTDTPPTAGTRYYYRVVATYPAGISAPSNVASAAVGQEYRINAGGGAVGAFAADAFASGGNTAFNGGFFDTGGVSDPAPQSVYQSERWGVFSYSFTSLTPGKSYKVRLHFSEFAVFSPGQRVFNVAINGTQRLTNYDIVAKVGAFKGTVEEFTVPADSTGKITVDFSAVVAFPKVSGIEILIP